MLTYEEFAAQHHRVVDAAEKTGLSKLTEINLTGLTKSEAINNQIGVYITLLVEFFKETDVNVRNNLLARAVGTLIATFRRYSAEQAPCISPEDIDGLDKVSISLMNSQLADFCRMNPATFLGYAMTYCDYCVQTDEDLHYWLTSQFDLISKYAFTHYIDLSHIISELD